MQCLFLQDLSFVLLVLLPWPVSGKFTVIGPQEPVIALVGREAILPCHLSPQINAQDMDVMWFYGESSLMVHQYKDRQDHLNHQHQEYKGRTEFLRDDISNGSVALKLRHIRPSDEGKYRCLFESSSTSEEAEYQVYIAGKGSAPHIYAVNDENKRHRLVCTSTGWYPEPEVQWRKNQEMLSPQDTTIKKEENGLFSVETSITVSMNSIVNVSCFIGNPLLRQKLEASFSLSYDLFTNDTRWTVIWIVTGVLGIAVILIVIFVIWKLKKGKGVNKKESVSYASVKSENEYGVNKDELDVYKDEPGVDKEDPVVTKDATDINNDRHDQDSITLESIERNGEPEWNNTGNIQKKRRGIEPSSLFHHEEVQGDQKEMEGHHSPCPDTLKRPVVNKDTIDVNNDRWDQTSTTLERIESNCMEEQENPGNLQKEEREIEPSSPLHQEEIQEGDQKEMEGNLSPSPDTLKRPAVNKEETEHPVSYDSINSENEYDSNTDGCDQVSTTLERIESNCMEENENPGNLQNEQREIEPFSSLHQEEVQEGDQKEMEGNLSPSPDTLKRPGVDKEHPAFYDSVKFGNEYGTIQDATVVIKDETDINNDRCGYPDQGSRILEITECNSMQKSPNTVYMQKEQIGMNSSSPCHLKEVQVGKWKKQKMEGVNKDMESGEGTNGRIGWKREKITLAHYPAWAGRPLERREWKGMQKGHNPGYMQNKQTGIKPFPFSHHEEIQKRDQKKMERNLSPSPVTLKEPDLQTAQKYRVDVTLDVSTVEPFLLPRMDGKSFSSSSHKNNHKNTGGLESLYCMLGKERFTSGKCYWEVQVEDMMKWIVGFCKESVMRKRGCEITPINGFWTISLRKENEYWVLSSPPTHLLLGVAPKVVGVFLDYEAGCISFYNVTDDSHICTFQDTFREALQPCIGHSNLIHSFQTKKSIDIPNLQKQGILKQTS